MALFTRKKEATQKTTQNNTQGYARNEQSNLGSGAADRDLSSVLLRPRMTEKSASQNNRGMYTFVVRRDATKYDVRDAVKSLFNVTPRKVTIINRVPRTTHSRSKGRNMTVSGLKKANVFLKKGDRIDLA